MRHIHRELGKVRHMIMYPFLVLLIIGIALLLVLLQKPAPGDKSILEEWVNDPTQNL
jgi:hypothetical protein